jgi:glyoxylase-like metal-dependent hydrolase (beta-lactamase superfamily II)
MTIARHHALSRRGFCLCCMTASTVAATGGWLTPGEAFAEARGIVELIKSEAAKAPITIHRLRGNVSVLEGSGGNIAVLTGPDGKLLIDAGISVSRPQIATALAALSADPVTNLINTHWHFDHADGNEWLHSVGARIMAHENTRKHLSVMQRVEDWNYDFAALQAGGLPVDVFATERTVKLNGSTVALKYYGAAHTDSDISVTFTEADILHTGDTFWNGIYPFIDYSTGGNIDGMIRAADANLAAATDRTLVIPGHGQPVSNRVQLQEYRDMLVAIRGNVAALKQQGRSVADTVGAKPTAAFDAKWGGFVIDPAFFTRLVYEGV